MKTRDYALKSGKRRTVVLDHVGIVAHDCRRFCFTSSHVVYLRSADGAWITLCGADRRGRARYSDWWLYEADVDAVLQWNDEHDCYSSSTSGPRPAGHEVCLRCESQLIHLDRIARQLPTGNPAIWHNDIPYECPHCHAVTWDGNCDCGQDMDEATALDLHGFHEDAERLRAQASDA